MPSHTSQPADRKGRERPPKIRSVVIRRHAGETMWRSSYSMRRAAPKRKGRSRSTMFDFTEGADPVVTDPIRIVI